jgi:glutaconate CoA-transferase subunit B
MYVLHDVPFYPGSAAAGNSGGIRGGPAAAVITTLWVLRFDPVSREAYLAQVHPGVSPDEVRENTGWALPVSTQLAVPPLPDPRNWR